MSDRPSVKNQQLPAPRKKLPKAGDPVHYEYKLVGYIPEMRDVTFNIMGEQGFRFCGTEGSGKAVFIREK